jgi:signal transduction histidine kinase
VTGRIVAGFVSVLAAVLIAVVIPLGLIVTAQQGRDFTDQVNRVAQAVGALAEEHLDDFAPVGALDGVIARLATGGYRIVVLNPQGAVIAHAGPDIPDAVLRAVATGGRLPQSDDSLTVITAVQDADRILGRIVVERSTATLETNRQGLWVMLATAAAGALGIGVLIAWLLSRWIARPLVGLARAAHGVGRGAATTRIDEQVGPIPVRQVAAAFNAMSDRVRALLETQRGMTAEVSHQLRTPLAALRLRLELLHDELPGSVAADVTDMVEETGRLSRLLDGLLAIARAESAAPDPVCTDIGAVVADRAAFWQPVAEDRQVLLLPNTDATLADITPGHLEQVLDNLLDNAIDATPPGGHVTVATRAASAQAELTVSDTGPGMTDEQRERAMDRWATTGGTGLGLAIAQRLVEADGGSLRLGDAVGGGLCVTVRYALAARDRAMTSHDAESR